MVIKLKHATEEKKGVCGKGKCMQAPSSHVSIAIKDNFAEPLNYKWPELQRVNAALCNQRPHQQRPYDPIHFV